MATKLRKCFTAPNFHQYIYCPKCRKGDPNKIWMYQFCSENCKAIYEIFDEYRMDKIDFIEAHNRFNKYDLSDINHFHPLIQNVIAEVKLKVSESKPKKTARKKKVNED